MIVGATWKIDEIAYWQARVPVNMMMRIFPNTDGMPPDWTDARFAYCAANGVIPFTSSKCDGDATKLAALKVWMQAMPAWVKVLYHTDRHEPEGDIAAAAYQANFNACLAMVNTLGTTLRPKVRCGPVLTRQATENKAVATPTAFDGTNATGGVYSTYDPGTGDFFGVDFYHNSWGSPSTTPVTTPIAPATMLAKFKAYKKSSADTRARIMPELGLIGFPTDTDGSKRAAWYQGMHDELRKWTVATVGFDFLGFVVWNTEGKSGTTITGLGKKRWFQFDRRHNGGPFPATGTVTDTEGGYDTLTGSKVLATFNALAAANAGTAETPPADTTGGSTTGSGTGGTTGTGGGTTEPPPDPTDPGPGVGTPVDDPGTTTTPVKASIVEGTPYSPRAYVRGPEFTMLVTSPALRAVLSPIYDWSSMSATLRFNAVGSGQFTCPARPELIAAVGTPNNRVTIIRNPAPALGIKGGILISGPIESKPYKWSDDSDIDGGLGSITVSFASNETYIAERITFPNPAAAAAAQGTDYYTRSQINAELVMRELVNLNAGPGALAVPNRRVPLLALGDLAGVGGLVDVTTRFDPMADVLRYLAVLGGNLGWRVRDTGTALLFEVYAPKTRLGAYFGRSRGNVHSIAVDTAAPVATVAIAGGTGSGAGRLVVERASADFNTGGWRRIETFVNQDGVSTTLGLQQYADADLDAKKSTTTVTVEPTDPFGGGYELKYRLGDVVPAELPTSGTRVLDIVTAVDVKANVAEVATFTPTIGPRPKLTDDQFISDMQTRLQRVERS